MTDAVNLREKLDGFTEHWSPRIIAEMNGHEVMVVRIDGEFVWHSHSDTDDFFLVLDGVLDVELRDRTVKLGPGDLYVVPRGVEHRPAARHGEVQMMLIERKGTPNTGDEKTATTKVRI